MLGQGIGREQLSSSGCAMLLQEPGGGGGVWKAAPRGTLAWVHLHLAWLLSWFGSSMCRLPA